MNLGTAIVLLVIVAWLGFLLYRHIKKVRARRALIKAGAQLPCSGGCDGCSANSSSCEYGAYKPECSSCANVDKLLNSIDNEVEASANTSISDKDATSMYKDLGIRFSPDNERKDDKHKDDKTNTTLK